MKKLFLCTILAMVTLFTSCGLSSHMTSNTHVSQTNVNLSQANYRIVGTAKGVAKAGYVFGIGGLSRRALQANATAKMMENAGLKGSEAVINITTDTKVQYFLHFYIKKTVTTYGVIIEFTE